MKNTILRSASLLILVLWSASAVFSQTDAEYKAKIDQINMAMEKVMITGDNEAFYTHYAKDVIIMPSYSPMQEGIEAVRKADKEMAQSGWKITAFKLTSYKVSSSGKLVTEVGTYKMSMKGPGMDKTMDDVGKYLTVYEVQPDKSLKLKIDIWNSDNNPMKKM